MERLTREETVRHGELTLAKDRKIHRLKGMLEYHVNLFKTVALVCVALSALCLIVVAPVAWSASMVSGTTDKTLLYGVSIVLLSKALLMCVIAGIAAYILVVGYYVLKSDVERAQNACIHPAGCKAR